MASSSSLAQEKPPLLFEFGSPYNYYDTGYIVIKKYVHFLEDPLVRKEKIIEYFLGILEIYAYAALGPRFDTIMPDLNEAYEESYISSTPFFISIFFLRQFIKLAKAQCFRADWNQFFQIPQKCNSFASRIFPYIDIRFPLGYNTAMHAFVHDIYLTRFNIGKIDRNGNEICAFEGFENDLDNLADVLNYDNNQVNLGISKNRFEKYLRITKLLYNHVISDVFLDEDQKALHILFIYLNTFVFTGKYKRVKYVYRVIKQEKQKYEEYFKFAELAYYQNIEVDKILEPDFQNKEIMDRFSSNIRMSIKIVNEGQKLIEKVSDYEIYERGIRNIAEEARWRQLKPKLTEHTVQKEYYLLYWYHFSYVIDFLSSNPPIEV